MKNRRKIKMGEGHVVGGILGGVGDWSESDQDIWYMCMKLSKSNIPNKTHTPQASTCSSKQPSDEDTLLRTFMSPWSKQRLSNQSKQLRGLEGLLNAACQFCPQNSDARVEGSTDDSSRGPGKFKDEDHLEDQPTAS